MSKIKNLKIEKFLEDLASKSPIPGGGAAAGLSGAIAAALIEMVCNLTIGKAGYNAEQLEIKRIKVKATKIKKELLKLTDEDVNAFSRVMLAYREKDRKKIRTALKNAADVPAKVAKLGEEIISLAKRVIVIGNKNAISDTKSAFYLAKASRAAALENVKINLRALAAIS